MLDGKKHKAKDKLLGAIKSVVEENHTKTKLDKLEQGENNILWYNSF